MNIPNFENSKVIDEKGHWTPQWANLIQILISELQNNVSNEGFFIPGQAATNIVKLNNNNSNRAILYDNDANSLIVSLNGVFKKIDTSTYP